MSPATLYMQWAGYGSSRQKRVYACQETATYILVYLLKVQLLVIIAQAAQCITVGVQACVCQTSPFFSFVITKYWNIDLKSRYVADEYRVNSDSLLSESHWMIHITYNSYYVVIIEVTQPYCTYHVGLETYSG